MGGDQSLKFWVLIPARRHSSRFPNKMMAMLQRKPLVMHVFDRVVDALWADQTVRILVDDEKNFEALKVMTPRLLMTAKNARNGSERCLDGAKQLGLSSSDIILNVQGDEPFVSKSHIDGLKKPFLEGIGMHDLVSTVVTPIQHRGELTDPNRVKVEMDSAGFATGFFREIPDRQKKILYKHLGLYGYSRATLETYLDLPMTEEEIALGLEQLRMLANNLPIHCSVCHELTFSVDTPQDLVTAEKILNAMKSEGVHKPSAETIN